MAEDLTPYVSAEIEPRLRAKAEALGIEFNAYLHGLIGDAAWGRGEVDDDPVIDDFIGDHAEATGSYVSLEEFSGWAEGLKRRRA